jgi:hypothetical protein
MLTVPPGGGPGRRQSGVPPARWSRCPERPTRPGSPAGVPTAHARAAQARCIGCLPRALTATRSPAGTAPGLPPRGDQSRPAAVSPPVVPPISDAGPVVVVGWDGGPRPAHLRRGGPGRRQRGHRPVRRFAGHRCPLGAAQGPHLVPLLVSYTAPPLRAGTRGGPRRSCCPTGDRPGVVPTPGRGGR